MVSLRCSVGVSFAASFALLCALVLTAFGVVGCAYPVSAEGQDTESTTSTMPPSNDESDYLAKQGASGGWSRDGTLVAGDTTKTVTAQVDFPIAGNYIVEFTVSPPGPLPGVPAPNNLVYVSPEALVQWTVAGQTLTRRLSIGNGTTIEGSAQAVRITCLDQSLIPDTPHVSYGVTLNISPGVRAPSAVGPVLLLTDPTPGVGSFGQPSIVLSGGIGTGVTLDIPPDAGATSVFITALRAGGVVVAPGDITVLITFDGAGSYTTGSIPLAEYDIADADTWVPIPPGANKITLSVHANHTFAVNVILGIDG